MSELKIKRYLFILITVSTVLRLVISAITELGNDEVYYWTYALFPSLSYFDHPPMVGLLIWLTTFGTLLHSEISVRLGAVISGSFCLWLIYKIGEYIKGSKTGLYASLLYASSLYGSIISGTFILPDSPQVVFWLLTLYFFLKSIVKDPNEQKTGINLYLAGITTGFAMVSKYHSAFLWLGAILYIIFYNRNWLKRKELYLSIFFTILLFSPVLIWNYSTNFMSFTFHSGRIGFFSEGININTFLRELSGQIFYNNPVNYFLIIFSLIALFRKKFEIKSEHTRLLLLTGLPVILLFLFISLSRSTFPHWSAPGYFSLILIVSLWLSSKNFKKLVPVSVKISLSFAMIIAVCGVLIVNYGMINFTQTENKDKSRPGDKDVSLEMYGWKQIGEGFKKIHEGNITSSNLFKTAPVFTNKWYLAAHIDYYAAYPLGLETYTLGPVIDIRNYFFINRKRNSINRSLTGYYITTSHDYKEPDEIVAAAGFEIAGKPDTINVYRCDKIVEYAFVYKLNLYRKLSF